MDTSSLPYTCNTCLVAFRSNDAQRDHMRRDWHLYNIKRRVATLPPVSQETFNEKVLAARATSSAAAAKASFEKTCPACQKTFYSENSYRNHLNSARHKLREATRLRDNNIPDDTSSVMSSTFSLGEPIGQQQQQQQHPSAAHDEARVSAVTDGIQKTTIEEEQEENEKDNGDGTGFSPTRCLFCNKGGLASIQENVEHMYKYHGMFIPEREYLVDLEGLLRYLYRKITENNECLYCHVIRSSAAGINTHMRDKGHCMIAFETEEEQIEIGQFYDFTSTYSDDEEEESPDAADEDEEGWETETSASSVDEDEIHGSTNAPVIYESEYELHLPSGRSVGHRSLARYYRQNLHNYPSMAERQERQLAIENGEIQQEQPSNNNRNRGLVTRANGGLGMVGATEGQKRTALRSERKERNRAIRQEQKYTARVNRAANNQKHFRVSNSSPSFFLSFVFFFADSRSYRINSFNNGERFLLSAKIQIRMFVCWFLHMLRYSMSNVINVMA